MGTHKTPTLETVVLQNVTFSVEGLDPVLSHVDFELPLDQTVLVQSTNPLHSLQFLQLLAGEARPVSGSIKWNEKDIFHDVTCDLIPHELIGTYFENRRPHPKLTVFDIFKGVGLHADRIDELFEQFNLHQHGSVQFGKLSFEVQKMVQLISVIAREPQMLILEDPALGLSESNFLEILDLIQFGQRRGGLRHVYFTNHHPTASRHINPTIIHVEDGLLYVEEIFEQRKIFNF